MKIGEAELVLPDYQDSDRDRVRKKFNAFLRTIEGTYPMNRSYGIRNDVVDVPLPVAQVMIAEDVYEKAERYIREVSVVDIQFKMDAEDVLYPIIYAEPANTDGGLEESYQETESVDSEEDEYESD